MSQAAGVAGGLNVESSDAGDMLLGTWYATVYANATLSISSRGQRQKQDQ
jgi:hypothetical protein